MPGADFRPAPGGFSILLYSPPNFERTSGFDYCKKIWDPRGPTGTEEESQTKCVFQMRKLLDLKEPKDLGPDQDVVMIHSSFTRRVVDEVADLRQKITNQASTISTQVAQISSLKTEVRVATVVALIALAITVILTLVPVILQREHHMPPHASAITSPSEHPGTSGP